MSVTIYHNPACGTSRNTLALIRATGTEPQVVEYLTTSPSREELVSLLDRMETTPRELLRQKGAPYAELGLDDPSLGRDALIVLDLLERPLLEDFVKEDGEVIRAETDAS